MAAIAHNVPGPLFQTTLLSALATLVTTISASAGTATLTSSLYTGYQYASPNVEPGSFARVNDTLYYVGSNYDSGRELWLIENLGSHSGTAGMVRDIRPGLASSEVAEITALGSRVFFSANNGTGRELWMSDGSWTGTAIVAEMSVAPNAGSSPRALTVLNGRVLFWARSDDRKVSLWTSDGTEEGTQLLKEAGSEDIDSVDFTPLPTARQSRPLPMTAPTPSF